MSAFDSMDLPWAGTGISGWADQAGGLPPTIQGQALPGQPRDWGTVAQDVLLQGLGVASRAWERRDALRVQNPQQQGQPVVVAGPGQGGMGRDWLLIGGLALLAYFAFKK